MIVLRRFLQTYGSSKSTAGGGGEGEVLHEILTPNLGLDVSITEAVNWKSQT